MITNKRETKKSRLCGLISVLFRQKIESHKTIKCKAIEFGTNKPFDAGNHIFEMSEFFGLPNILTAVAPDRSCRALVEFSHRKSPLKI